MTKSAATIGESCSFGRVTCCTEPSVKPGAGGGADAGGGGATIPGGSGAAIAFEAPRDPAPRPVPIGVTVGQVERTLLTLGPSATKGVSIELGDGAWSRISSVSSGLATSSFEESSSGTDLAPAGEFLACFLLTGSGGGAVDGGSIDRFGDAADTTAASAFAVGAGGGGAVGGILN